MNLPTAKVWPDMIQGSEAWLAARKGRATASEFSKIVTPTGKLSKQAEAYARRMARESVCDDPFEFAGNRATDWGNEYEPFAREAFAQETGLDLVEIGFAIHERMTCVGCSPDGIIIDDGEPVAGLEIKCPGPDKLVDWHLGDGGVPADYLPQVHGSMIVTGLRCWEFVGYFPGAPLYRARAEWDAYTDKLRAALEQFVIDYAKIRPAVLRALGREAA